MGFRKRKEVVGTSTVPEQAEREPDPLRFFGQLQPRSVQRESAQLAERLLVSTAALADAVTPEAVFEAAVNLAASALGATSTELWLVDADRTAAAPVAAFGVRIRAQRAPMALSDQLRSPMLDAIETGRPVWLESRARLLELYPHLASRAKAGPAGARAWLPMVIEGRSVGVLTLTFEEASAPTPDERPFGLVLARHCGQALERVRLGEAERTARRRTEHSESQTAMLYRLSDSVEDAQSLDAVYAIALDTVHKALGAERAAVLVRDADGVMRFKAWRRLSDSYRAAVEGHCPWSPDEQAPQQIFVADVRNDPALIRFGELLRQEGIGSLAFIPLVFRSELLGKLMLYWSTPHPFGQAEADTARHIAAQVSSALGWRIGEQEKEELIRELSDTVRVNELFTGVVGHDLRNPLAAISATAELLLRRSSDAPAAEQLNRILHCGTRMTRLIDQLLDVTRVRSGGGMPCDPRRMNLELLCRLVIDELLAKHPHRRIVLDTSGDVHGVWDFDRLAQVVSNLASNAIRHGKKDGPVSIAIDGLSDGQVALRVSNEGTISTELSATLFEPFRGSTRRYDGEQGLGLGLYISQQIVLAHDGAIGVSASGGLTTFTVTLPRTARSRSSHQEATAHE